MTMISRTTKNKVLGLVCSWLCVGCVVYANGVKPRAVFTKSSDIEMAKAIDRGDIVGIERAIKNGVDKDTRGEGGVTFLIYGLLKGDKTGFEVLLEKGANPNIQTNVDGNSATSLAAMSDDSWYLRTVLKHNGDPNVVNPKTTETPIFEAISRLRKENVGVLIKAGANLNYKDWDSSTPLLQAAGGNQFDMVYEMLMAGADPTVFNKSNCSLFTLLRAAHIDAKSEEGSWKTKVETLLTARGMDPKTEP
jgi:ankyrin repeat protein